MVKQIDSNLRIQPIVSGGPAIVWLQPDPILPPQFPVTMITEKNVIKKKKKKKTKSLPLNLNNIYSFYSNNIYAKTP